MNIYYTAKDIEELVAKGIYQLDLGPNTSLTDFARETAEQLDVVIVDISAKGDPTPSPAARPVQPPQPQVAAVSRSYNKPRGCQPEGKKEARAEFQPEFQGSSFPQAQDDEAGSAPVNRLVDLMGKFIKRGA